MNTFNIYRADELEFPDFATVEDARQFFEANYRGTYTRGMWERLNSTTICYFDALNDQLVQIVVNDSGSIAVHVVY